MDGVRQEGRKLKITLVFRKHKKSFNSEFFCISTLIFFKFNLYIFIDFLNQIIIF